MLLELGLPNFNTVMFNCSFNFQRSLLICDNLLVSGMLTSLTVSSFFSFSVISSIVLCTYVVSRHSMDLCV